MCIYIHIYVCIKKEKKRHRKINSRILAGGMKLETTRTVLSFN